MSLSIADEEPEVEAEAGQQARLELMPKRGTTKGSGIDAGKLLYDWNERLPHIFSFSTYSVKLEN